MRDFNTRHPGCHFEIGMDCPDLRILQMIEQLQINPGWILAISSSDDPLSKATSFAALPQPTQRTAHSSGAALPQCKLRKSQV
jgi:hypothetical protein